MPHTSQEVPLAHHLSQARFDTYRRCASNDAEAFDLYCWNLQLTGAVFEMLGVVEIAVRNSIDRELRQWNAAQPQRSGEDPYNEEWLKHPAPPLYSLLNTTTRYGDSRSTYTAAKGRAVQDGDIRHPGHPRHGIDVNHDDVLAHVTFGTWPHLFPDPKFANSPRPPRGYSGRREGWRRVMWDQALKYSFPGQGGSYTVSRWISRMHELRNRVAHHEPLILTDIRSYHRTAARILKSIDPKISDWYTSTSRVPEILKHCPVDLTPYQLP